MPPKAEKKKRKAMGRLWEVEHLVAERESTTVGEFLGILRYKLNSKLFL